MANLRERKRMTLINKGFEILRNRLPIRELIDNGTNRSLKTKLKSDRWTEFDAGGTKGTLLESRGRLRLTKVDILKLTIEYIKQLNKILSGSAGRPTTLSLSIDHSRYVRANKMKPKRYHQKKFRDGQQCTKNVQRQQQMQKIVTHSKQATSHLFVCVKSNANYASNIGDDTVTTTTRGYLLSCSRLVETHGYNSLGQRFYSDSERFLDLKDTKLWIPGTE